jgi:hypothetical protein
MAILEEVFRQLTLLAKRSRPRRCKHKGTNLPSAAVRIDGIGCAEILEAIRPFIIGSKGKNADVVLAFIKDRKENLLDRDALGRVKRKPYTVAQINLICSIRTSKMAKSSETIRQAPNVI